MYQLLMKNWEKTKYIVTFVITVTLLLLLSVVYKSDEKITKKSELSKSYNETASDIINFRKFILNQIKSPFINVNYEIIKGDTIEKILKKYSVKNTEIQTIINQYKKFGKSNQLLAGNKIDIIIEKGVNNKKNSIIKFSVPITKSTTIEIS